MPRRSRGRAGKRKNLTVVSNFSVIVAFAKIGRLDILKKLFKEVLVPRSVWFEATVKDKPGSENISRAGFIRVKEVHDGRLVSLLEEFIDQDEAEAIVLALESGADLLLADDGDDRRLAERLGLRVMGTLGVLALAKYRGIIPEVKPIIDELTKKGFRFPKKTLENFLRELGELTYDTDDD